MIKVNACEQTLITAVIHRERHIPMRNVFVLLIFLLTPPIVQAGASLKEARTLLQEGDYAEAREMYEVLVKDPKTRREATLGLSQAWESQGEYDKAEKVIDDLLKDTPKDADLLARRADLHYTRGRLQTAEESANAAIAINAENFSARWTLGRSFRDRGEMEKANEQFLWFIRVSQKRDLSDPEEQRLAGLAGLERAKALHLTDEYQNIISNYFRAASLNMKKTRYWQGEYEAGRVFMDKHDKPKAFAAFENVMTINPRAAEVLVAKGQMMASLFEFKDAERYAEQALKVNPRYVPALNLMAEVHWFSGENDTTMKTLVKARAVNPRDEGTLARIAACHFAQNDNKAFEAVIAEAKKNNPKCYTFYVDLAALLDQRKFSHEAEKYYNIAAQLQPKFADAQTGLGMMYMRMSKEEEARKVLREAQKADPFNVRVYNSLEVLKHLDRYETLQTGHFVVRYDRKNDTVLANFMAIYLEDIYKELADQFDYRPKGPFQIQIFSQHQMFSGRVVAVPDLHTIGACTGPLVAMCSPRETSGVIQKPFNWNRVIRHELVHVFNLEQTKGRVPHWFTEGLAVRYEGPNIPPTWHALLAEKFANDELLNLDNILLGFIRPRSPAQWQQAYLQSLLYVEYLTKTHGEKAIGKMLAAFSEGLDTGPALEKALNVKQAAFEKGYREFLAERVKKNAAAPPPKTLTLKQLRDAHAKDPNDMDIAAQLAEKYYSIGKKRDAKELVEKVLAKEPKNVAAITVQAMLLIDEGSADIAANKLNAIATEDLKDTKPLKLLLRLQNSEKNFNKAVQTCERARKIDPHDPYWIMELYKIYVKTDQKNKLVEIFEEVARIDPDQMKPRKELAQHHSRMGKHAEAERYARMALEIDVTDRECQTIFIDSLVGLNRQAEADRYRKIFD